MNDDIIKHLLSQIAIKDDALRLTENFDLIEKEIYSHKSNWAELIKSKMSSALCEIFSTVTDERTLIDIFRKFKTEISMLDVARFDIAFEPSRAFIEKLAGIISDEVGHKVILDIKVSNELIGGAQISFQGRFCDISLKKSIDESLKSCNIIF